MEQPDKNYPEARPLLRFNLWLGASLLLLAALGILPTDWPWSILTDLPIRLCLAGLVLIWLVASRPAAPPEGSAPRWWTAVRMIDWTAPRITAGVAIGALILYEVPGPVLALTAHIGLITGLAGILVRELLLPRGERDERLRVHKRFLGNWIVVLLFLVNAQGVLSLVTLLTPTVLDPALAALDGTLVAGLNLRVTQASIPGVLAELVFASAPLLPLAVLGLLYREGPRQRFERLLVSFVLVAIVSWIIHLLVPAVGPIQFVPQPDGHQHSIQATGGTDDVENAIAASPMALPTPRGSTPSLPVAWGILAVLAAFGTRRRVFWSSLSAGLFVFGASLFSGHSYLITSLLTVPFGFAIWSLAGLARSGHTGLARKAGLEGLVLILGPTALALSTVVLWKKQLFTGWSFFPLFLALTALTARASLRLARREPRGSGEAPDRPLSPRSLFARLRPGDPEGLRLHQVLILFFCSGLTGLVYEVVFEQELALVFGSTARATTTVLSVYMTGLALGAFVGGRLSDRVRNPLLFYALAEVVVGLICFTAPLLFEMTNRLYLGMVSGLGLSAASESFIQVACCSVVVLLPAMIMGTTMPLLAKHATPELSRLKRNVALLYSANTLGAAVGTLLATYWLISALGIDGTLRLATLANFAVAAIAFRLARRIQPREQPSPGISARRWGGAYGASLIVAAGLVGFISFSLEVIWVHLLSAVAGNSVYAFGLMLFAFLAGLGIGSSQVARWRISDDARPARLAFSVMCMGACVLILLPVWDHIPPFLGQYGLVDFASTFEQREFIRFSVCFGMMIGPTMLIGMIFPQLVDLSTRSVDSLGRHVGLVSFFNTSGNIAGAIVAGLVLIPFLGSYRSIQFLGTLALALGAVLALWVVGRKRWVLIGGSLTGIAMFSLGLPASWDATALTLGTNVYFRYQPYGQVVELREGIEGGLSTINRTERDGRIVTTMLTNGKFQGDDHHELRAQTRFATYPLLHCKRRDSALIIGLGTGVTAGVLADAGFSSIHVAELSTDLIDLARRYFSHVNSQVVDDPRTSLHVTDGRNLLLVDEQTYDLISMEVTSIWFAGAANLYNREFYELANRRLRPGGVLQQWLQLHHLSPADIASVLISLKSVFPEAVLYFAGTQGVLVASQEPLRVDFNYIDDLESNPAMRRYRGWTRFDSFWPLIGERLLERKELEEYVASVADTLGVQPEDLISTDRNRFLEYSTPRGKARPPMMAETARMLARYHDPTSTDDLAGPEEATDLMIGARLLGAGRFDQAQYHLERARNSPVERVRTTAERLLAVPQFQ